MDFLAVKNYILERLWEELPDNLFYHGVEHTISVNNYASLIAEIENITGDELVLLNTAAICHDFGFIFRYSNNECLACSEMRKILPGFSYCSDDIDVICSLILATKIPQRPTNHLGEILCDADLFYLGTEQFSEKSDALRNELISENHIFTDQEWLKFQINFLEEHSYFTEYGKEVLNVVKEQNVEQLRNELKQLQINSSN